jgi:predicted dehydrogenase
MKDIRLGVIGTGSRSGSYMANIPDNIRTHVKLVAVADPSAKQRAKFVKEWMPDAAPRKYENGRELLDAEQLDALIIGSANHAHVADAVPAFSLGIPIVLEKPVAIDVEGCRRLWEAYVAGGRPPVVVGFVLRYTHWYSKAYELVRSGTIGQVLSVDGDESIGVGLTNYMYRGWRRWDDKTGGFIVEKCCHDLDLMRWFADAEARRVYSIARKTMLVPSTPKGERLKHFDNDVIRPGDLDYGDPETHKFLEETNFNSLYDEENDLPDHQQVMVEFDNGVLSTLSVCFAQPRGTRRMRVWGSQGYIEGDIGRSRIIVEKVAGENGRDCEEEVIDVEHDTSGHHGGDTHIVGGFWRAATGEQVKSKAGLREGIEAVLIAIAAERSKHTGEPIDVMALRRQVFGEDL